MAERMKEATNSCCAAMSTPMAIAWAPELSALMHALRSLGKKGAVRSCGAQFHRSRDPGFLPGVFDIAGEDFDGPCSA